MNNNRPGFAQQNRQTVPIAAVTPYRRDYTFRARIIDKSAPRQWNNDKGSGTLFSIVFMDSNSDTMQGRFFTDGFTKFYDHIQPGKVYTLSDFKIGVPQRQNGTTSDYEATFDQNSTISEIPDDGSIPSYSTKKVKSLETIPLEKDSNATIDYLVIIHSFKPCTPFTTKKGVPSFRRDFQVVDKSGLIVDVTFWGDIAQKWEEDFAVGRTLLLQNARFSEYNGSRSLQNSFTTSCQFGLTDNRAMSLDNWYKNANHDQFKVLRQMGDNQHDGQQQQQRRVYTRDRFADIDEELIIETNNERGEFFHIDGTITRINVGPSTSGPDGSQTRYPWYEACKGTRSDGKQCAKKVLGTAGDGFSCDSCGAVSQDCEYRYILNIQIADESGSRYISLFNQEAETLLGISASELHAISIRENGAEELAELSQSFTHKPVSLTVIAKPEQNRDGLPVVRYRCFRVEDVNSRADRLAGFAIEEIKHFKTLNQQASYM